MLVWSDLTRACAVPSRSSLEASGLTRGFHDFNISSGRRGGFYLHHGNVLLWWGWLDLAGHFDDSLHQARHILVHPVVGPVQIGSGRGADFLGLKLQHRSCYAPSGHKVVAPHRGRVRGGL